MIALGKYTLMSIALCVMLGCIASRNITREFQDASFSFGQVKQGTSVKVVVAEVIEVRDFTSAFEKEYQSEQGFVALVGRQIADSVKSILGCMATLSDNPVDAAALSDDLFDENRVNRIQALLAAAQEDYYLVVEAITIVNRKVTTAPMAMAGPAGGGANMIGGNTSETAQVTMHVTLWNVKEKKKVLGYAALGESPVTMLFYETALKNAAAEAIKNMVRYPATGTTM